MNAGEDMENAESTVAKYVALISLIKSSEDRLRWSEFIYLAMNLAVFIFAVNYISRVIYGASSLTTGIEMTLAFFMLVIGMAISTFWVASSMRQQLKLKLHHFQARFLERKMNCSGECILSDESIFFDPAIRHIESPDGKETLIFPTHGLSRMDGFIGSSKPRTYTWFMPSLFFIIYSVIFIWILLTLPL